MSSGGIRVVLCDNPTIHDISQTASKGSSAFRVIYPNLSYEQALKAAGPPPILSRGVN